MIEANDHLKSPNSKNYDPSKILLMDKRIKKLPVDIVGLKPIVSYNFRFPWGVINNSNTVPQNMDDTYSRYADKGHQVKGGYDAQKKYKSQLNKNTLKSTRGGNNFAQNVKSFRETARFDDDSEIIEATCEETGVKAPIQKHEWVSDGFSFRAHLDKEFPNDDFYNNEISDEQKDRMRSYFEVEYEEGEGFTGRGDEKVEYIKSFKMNPKTTPFLNKEQRQWIEKAIPLKSVKKTRVNRTTKAEFKRLLNDLFRGKETPIYERASQWVGIPALVRIIPNRVALNHISDTNYDERNDTINYVYGKTVVSNEVAKGLRDKKSPHYQKYILDPKVANEKAIGVTDMHKNACKICGKKSHNSKNCDIWSYNAQAMEKAWNAGIGFKESMPDMEFTVFKQPLMLVRKNTRYGGLTTMVKTNLYIADSRKPVATLMLWGDTADDYLEWMNNQTLGKGWNLSKDKIGDINRWRDVNGYVDSLTHDRLILKAHKAWVSRKKYKNKEAWAINVSINPQHGSYLEYTGENYRFIPQTQRKELDDMYERVKVSSPQMIIRGA